MRKIKLAEVIVRKIVHAGPQVQWREVESTLGTLFEFETYLDSVIFNISREAGEYAELCFVFYNITVVLTACVVPERVNVGWTVTVWKTKVSKDYVGVT